MAKVLGIGGIFFKAKDPVGLLAWYQKWLGFPSDFNSHATFSPTSMPEGACTVFSPVPADTDYLAGPRKGKQDTADAQRFMVNLIVDDLSLALQQVKAGGSSAVGGTKHEDFGAFSWFIDPEGNKVELWQPR